MAHLILRVLFWQLTLSPAVTLFFPHFQWRNSIYLSTPVYHGLLYPEIEFMCFRRNYYRTPSTQYDEIKEQILVDIYVYFTVPISPPTLVHGNWLCLLYHVHHYSYYGEFLINLKSASTTTTALSFFTFNTPGFFSRITDGPCIHLSNIWTPFSVRWYTSAPFLRGSLILAPDKYLIYDVMFDLNLLHAPNAILSPFRMCSC